MILDKLLIFSEGETVTSTPRTARFSTSAKRGTRSARS